MVAEIITIGDEILIGQTVDTNSAWMAKQLNAIGVDIGQITSIRDARPNILESLHEATKRADIIIMTGGLGPTRDDITKQVLCEYFETELVRDAEVLTRIETFFQSRGRDVIESNRQQADLPKACTILDNFVGTASGMWFEKEGKVFISMPGVPYEMKHLMENQALPRLKKKFKFPHIFHHTIMTEGIGESFLAELVKHWEDSLTDEDIKIAYLPSPGVVKVRLTAFGVDLKEIQEKVFRKAKEFESLVPNYVFGQNDQSAEEAIATLLKNSGKTVVTAESCTGGYLAHLLTATAGSSQYFLGSIIAYSNAIKVKQLGVRPDTLEAHGAVSRDVVEQMALNAREKMSADYALATSGVAGPDGGTDEKPVGTVWIAIANEHGVYAKKYLFEKNRERNIHRSALSAISLLRRAIEGQLKIGLE